MPEAIKIRTYPNEIHATLAKALLEGEGIAAEIRPDESAQFSSIPTIILGDAMTPFALFVEEQDLHQAETILIETESGEFAVDEDEEGAI